VAPRIRRVGLPGYIGLALACALAACGSKPRAAQPAPASGNRPSARLVVVGDSLAFGRFADTQAEAFPQLAAAALHARLELLAAPGVTSAQLTAQAVPGGGKVVVVEAGTNDFLLQTPRRRFADDYRALLAKVTAASPGAKLVCLTTWVPKDLPPARIPASFYDATIRRACTTGAVADLSLISAQPEARGPEGRTTFLGPGDAFHPNSAGHAAIARLIEQMGRA
jgi:lysophospholipase L1-like esterase